jgi:hypothetical protein
VAEASKPPSSIPTGVAAIATLFFLAATYLGLIGLLMLVSPGTASMALGAPLLSGLELAGPYMFLLMAGVGVVMLVPAVSAAAVDFRASLLWGGLGIIVRVIIVWYLYQEPVKRAFAKE